MPVTKAPFYAVPLTTTIHHTMGGLRINEKTQVLDDKGNPIPGLYAAGEITGGIHGGNRLGRNALTRPIGLWTHRGSGSHSPSKLRLDTPIFLLSSKYFSLLRGQLYIRRWERCSSDQC